MKWLRCALLCCSLVETYPKLETLYINTDETFANAVLKSLLTADLGQERSIFYLEFQSR